MTTKGTKAYTTPRPFGGFQIPISLQSAAIRRYCDERGLVFHLHANENLIPDSYLVLESVVASASHYEGIAMCSVEMLPRSVPHRRQLVSACISAGCRLHFLFEQMIVASADDHRAMEELLALGQIADPTPSRHAALRDVGALI